MEDKAQHFIGRVAQKAIIQKDGKVLLVRGIGDKVWELPGGRLHEGEEPYAGVAREVFEELGLTIVVDRPSYVCRSFHHKQGAWQVYIAYECHVEGSEEINVDPQEVEELRWFAAEEIKDLPMFDDGKMAVELFFKG